MATSNNLYRPTALHRVNYGNGQVSHRMSLIEALQYVRACRSDPNDPYSNKYRIERYEDFEFADGGHWVTVTTKG